MRIGKYELTRQLGQGGFGVVFAAHDSELDRDCALKFLLSQHSANPDLLDRFLKEARIAARIDHHGIVTVYECGQIQGTKTEADGGAFIAMELLKGEPLSSRLLRGPLSVAIAAELVRQIATTLSIAHAANIIHRDLKPDNVFLVPDRATLLGDRVKVLDFGIAKLVDAQQVGGGTSSELIFGSPRYMSPEQCRSTAKVDHRTDIYALGVMLFEMLTGSRPFEGDAGALLVLQQISEPPLLRSKRGDLPEAMEQLVSVLLEKDPAKRLQSMDAVIQALDSIAPSLPPLQPHGRGYEPVPAHADHRGAVTATNPPAGEIATSPPRRPRLAWLALGIPLLAIGGYSIVRTSTSPNPVAPPPDVGVAAPPADALSPSVPAGMIYVERATFPMGSTPAQIDDALAWCKRLTDPAQCRRELYEREQPVRRITVSGFFLERYERSLGELVAWLDHNPRTKIDGGWASLDGRKIVEVRRAGDDRPIVYRDGTLSVDERLAHMPATRVTHDGAAMFCIAHGRRLPTEAEWERAARGSEGRQFPWGNELATCADAVFGRVPGGACATLGLGPVAVDSDTRDRTSDGVMHLGGNVAEWVADAMQPYEACGDCLDVHVLATGEDLFVLRGGTAWGLAEQTRAAGRSRAHHSEGLANAGFRCAASIPKGLP